MTALDTGVRPAEPQDTPRAVRTLGRALAGYPALRHTVDPDGRAERVTAIQELFFTRVGLEAGRVWVADGGDAVAVWTTPHNGNAGAVFAEIGPRLAELCGTRAAAQEALDTALAPHRPTEPVWFLATVGVTPERQGAGLGGAVLRPGIEAAEAEGVTAFLETSDPRNLPFYQRLGFEISADVTPADGGPRTWCLRRPAAGHA
ncbi:MULTISPECIES: GNAT family N-acetyltransferase [Streptomyces]|uniref:Acetyltransferase (GNAT) family protein n=2 Tax=Streptomyces TaxID=1883 RepID=A0A1I6S0S0_9ACTN|nr:MULTISPECIES: GNAT family N-acetyltransferase [Streptomyces]QKV68201.1 GNAT family N-acetyltransferase [Streptomyces harbinensis]SFS70559.1 Acetyltransferase (GNAT) family protein [Streptomyces harbinensis]